MPLRETYDNIPQYEWDGQKANIKQISINILELKEGYDYKQKHNIHQYYNLSSKMISFREQTFFISLAIFLFCGFSCSFPSKIDNKKRNLVAPNNAECELIEGDFTVAFNANYYAQLLAKISNSNEIKGIQILHIHSQEGTSTRDFASYFEKIQKDSSRLYVHQAEANYSYFVSSDEIYSFLKEFEVSQDNIRLFVRCSGLHSMTDMYLIRIDSKIVVKALLTGDTFSELSANDSLKLKPIFKLKKIMARYE